MNECRASQTSPKPPAPRSSSRCQPGRPGRSAPGRKCGARGGRTFARSSGELSAKSGGTVFPEGSSARFSDARTAPGICVRYSCSATCSSGLASLATCRATSSATFLASSADADATFAISSRSSAARLRSRINRNASPATSSRYCPPGTISTSPRNPLFFTASATHWNMASMANPRSRIGSPVVPRREVRGDGRWGNKMVSGAASARRSLKAPAG